MAAGALIRARIEALTGSSLRGIAAYLQFACRAPGTYFNRSFMRR